MDAVACRGKLGLIFSVKDSCQPSLVCINESNLLVGNEPGEIWSCIMYVLYMKFPYLAQWNLISSFNINLT